MKSNGNFLWYHFEWVNGTHTGEESEPFQPCSRCLICLGCPDIPVVTCCNLAAPVTCFTTLCTSPKITPIWLYWNSFVCLLSSATSSLWVGTRACLLQQWIPSTKHTDSCILHTQQSFLNWTPKRMHLLSKYSSNLISSLKSLILP